MAILNAIAVILGIVVNAITLIAYGKHGVVSLPGNFNFELTHTRIWMLAIIGAFVSAYIYSRITGYWIFEESSDPRIPIEAVFLVGPWVLIAGFATGMF